MDRHEIDLVTERLLKRFGAQGLIGWGIAALFPDADLMDGIDESFADIRREFELSDDDLLSLHGDELLQGLDIASAVGNAVMQAEFVRKHTDAFIDRHVRDNWRDYANRGGESLKKAATYAGACSAYITDCRSLALRKLAAG